MVLEVAIIDVTDGAQQQFAAAYEQARHLVAATPGCGAMRMTQVEHVVDVGGRSRERTAPAWVRTALAAAAAAVVSPGAHHP